jgi:hypothetical protein
VYILATGGAVGDVFRDGIQVFLADAAVFGVIGIVYESAILLYLPFEQCRGTANEVFVNGEVAGEARDLEAHNFAANARSVSRRRSI